MLYLVHHNILEYWPHIIPLPVISPAHNDGSLDTDLEQLPLSDNCDHKSREEESIQCLWKNKTVSFVNCYLIYLCIKIYKLCHRQRQKYVKRMCLFLQNAAFVDIGYPLALEKEKYMFG